MLTVILHNILINNIKTHQKILSVITKMLLHIADICQVLLVMKGV